MVDVGAKPATKRRARAQGRIVMSGATLRMIEAGSADKGDVLGTARIAGIMAAKRTAELIPLCHPIALTHVGIEFDCRPGEGECAVVCRAVAETVGVTGVEMEALCAVQVALLTIYDMCKAVERGMHIEGVRLLEKSGGRSGVWRGDDENPLLQSRTP